jgi:4-diphosphocytidyl-2-C-methyl-D-erythritol kinase
MIIFSHAKINLFLDILGVDSVDHYHFLDSLFQEVSLADEIHIEESKSDSVVFEHLDITGDTTVNKALRLFKEKFAVKENFSIRVKKAIPAGAGLGGGSSNAATVLGALSKITAIPEDEVLELGQKIGSDVPFFFTGGLCRVRGKGEIIEPLKKRLDNIFFLIVYPNISISTKWAYSLVNNEKREKLLEKFLNNLSFNIQWLKNTAYNKFEAFVFPASPGLLEARIRLDELLSAPVSFMSGSGSSLVFAYSEEKEAKKAGKTVRDQSAYPAFLCRPLYRG